MSLKHLIQPRLVACERGQTVREVAQRMDNEEVGAILIVDEEHKPVGIVTDRDLVVRCLVQGADCSNTPIEDVMTSQVETANQTDGVFDVIEKMRSNKVRRIPVVDDRGKAVGLLSFGDLFQLLGQEIAALCEPVAPENPKLVSREKKAAAA